MKFDVLAKNATITLEMVARSAGVSPSTVSRILNGTARVSDAKRLAVEQAIARSNFKPNIMARGLAKGQTMSIGVLAQFIQSPFYGEALRGIEDALAGTCFTPLFVSVHWDLEDEMERMALLQSRRVDGIIVLTGKLSDAQLLAYAERLPIVVTGRVLRGENIISLTVDDYTGAYRATQHLIDYGHTRIAYIAGPTDHPDALERLRGYRQAMSDAGLTIDEKLIVQGDFLESGGANAMQQLIDTRQIFTAVFAANDQMAYGARLVLFRSHRRVPEDVSLVGFDDLPHSASTVPPLTSIRQPIYEIGKQAAKAMLQLINGETRTIKLSPIPPLELVLRESTRNLRS